MIYVASPYSHTSTAVRSVRFEHVCQYVARLIRDGRNAFSPIAHSHPVVLYGKLPGTWDDWRSWGVEILDSNLIDEVHVLKLPGWDQSEGVAEEVRIAKENGIPVEWVEP